MQDNYFKVLLLGDVIGQAGCRAVFFNLKPIIKKYNPDLVIINGENSADGFGIIPKTAEQLFQSGADVITTGNHVWQKPDGVQLLKDSPNILRPANYPDGAPGHGYCVVEKKGIKIAVINLEGRESMSNLDCPFKSAKDIIRKIKKEGNINIIVIDFHAESTSEKESLAHYLDGEVSLIAGTHTHIQTADEKILPKGTAYITDVGMTGPEDSVIGSDKGIALQRFMTQMPVKSEVAETAPMINAIFAEIDPATGLAKSIKRIYEKV
ncbi:MAG: TIGR00282 family metallophosphoesterase [Spirochaetia bacterium]|jgi:metallophosphoesterase (TIGR00282 family)|nr:TIGR00282 family metallophosphoesterase [Spirochaetia bacterium]